MWFQQITISAQKYRPFWVLALVLDLNQNSYFGRTYLCTLICVVLRLFATPISHMDPCNKIEVSILGVVALWGDCRDIPTDLGLW